MAKGLRIQVTVQPEVYEWLLMDARRFGTDVATEARRRVMRAYRVEVTERSVPDDLPTHERGE